MCNWCVTHTIFRKTENPQILLALMPWKGKPSINAENVLFLSKTISSCVYYSGYTHTFKKVGDFLVFRDYIVMKGLIYIHFENCLIFRTHEEQTLSSVRS